MRNPDHARPRLKPPSSHPPPMTACRSATTICATRFPVLGLQEFWYPAIEGPPVGWSKPVFLQDAGRGSVLLPRQERQGRGARQCLPPSRRDVVARQLRVPRPSRVLLSRLRLRRARRVRRGAGRRTAIADARQIHARVYPTATLKGIVFLWMGKGEPVPLEDSIPEEFFQPTTRSCSPGTPCGRRTGGHASRTRSTAMSAISIATRRCC